jgi:hypothetical protein
MNSTRFEANFKVCYKAAVFMRWSINKILLKIWFDWDTQIPVVSLNSLDEHLSPKLGTDARFQIIDPRTKLALDRTAIQ